MKFIVVFYSSISRDVCVVGYHCVMI